MEGSWASRMPAPKSLVGLWREPFSTPQQEFLTKAFCASVGWVLASTDFTTLSNANCSCSAEIHTVGSSTGAVNK